jgi:prepilin-type N-terminal cleavage/methylation domain-containing protein
MATEAMTAGVTTMTANSISGGGTGRGTLTGSQGGFSLIEVLVSLGLLAGVMVAVSSLFIFGGKEVKSGKEMTEAYTLGHDIVEEIDRLTYTQAYTYFAPTGTNLTTATSYTITTNGSGTLSAAADATRDAWQAEINTKLEQGNATIEFEGLNTTGGAAAFTAAVAVRVSVTMQWAEGTRTRFLHLRTVRF